MAWKNADVVVIGGGVQGCASAYNLAKLGVKKVILIEKNGICSGSTGRCGAGIRAQWGTEMNCRFGLACLDIFENLEEELGMSVGLNQGGYLMVAYKENEFDQLKANIKLQNSLGIKSGVVTRDEAYSICPGLSADDALGFTFHQRDGHADPFLTTYAYMEAAKRLGVEFLKFTEVTAIKVEDGQVRTVVTNRGEIDTPVVLNTAGGYFQDVAAMVDLELPIHSENHDIMVTEPVEPGVCPPMLMSFSGNYYLQQRPDGTIVGGCSPIGHPMDSDLRSRFAFLEHMSNVFTKLLPRAKDIRVVRQWSGLYNMSPDCQPILGEAAHVKGFFLSGAYSGHGFMFAPITGKLMAQLITRGNTDMPIHMLHYRRFAEGKLIIEPAVV